MILGVMRMGRIGQNVRVTSPELAQANKTLIAEPASPVAPQDARRAQFKVSEEVLAIALMLSLWMAFGNFVLAIIDGLGSHPARRLLIGIALVLSIVLALWQRAPFCRALRTRPWLVVLVATGQLGAVIADGALNGTYDAVSVTSLGLAAIVARPRTVWLCVLVLDAGYAGAVLVEHPPASLAASGELARVLGTLLGYPFGALITLGLAALFARYVANVDGILGAVRKGLPALTPALTHALQLGAGPAVGLLTASSLADLTPDEIRAVEDLAKGRRPKQIAFEWGMSLATVRKHLKHAKRKTGARTLPELAAMTAAPEWPG